MTFNGLHETDLNKDVVNKAQLYVTLMVPALIIQAINDLQRKFLIQMSLGHIQLKSQVASTGIHFIFNYIFVIKMNMGIRGTAFATLITNIYSFAYNWYHTCINSDLDEVNQVSIFSKQIYSWKLFKTQILLGLANIIILLLDWICF